ncbi:MAG: hypothetical protein ACREXX_23520 [Gammaproteobacteria bacterium]
MLLAVLVERSAHAEWVDWVMDSDLETRYDANLNQASISSEEESAFSVHSSVDVGRVFQLAERTRLFAGGGIGGDIFARFEKLDSFDGRGRVSLLHKFGLGDAPWLRAFASGGYQEVVADQRSGPRFTVGAVAGKRFSPRFDARLEYSYTHRSGGSGPRVVMGVSDQVFDQQFHLITLEGNVLLTEQWLLTAGFTFRQGDFVSNAQASRFAILAANDFEAVARDQVFGGWVYRLQGNGYEPFLRLNYGLGERWSVDLGYRFQFSSGGGLDYRNHVVSAVVLFRY